jgi:hypothetical protein
MSYYVLGHGRRVHGPYRIQKAIQKAKEIAKDGYDRVEIMQTTGLGPQIMDDVQSPQK